MSEQEQDQELALGVKVEASITDGVFAIDYGIQDEVIVSLRFSVSGADKVETLLAAVGEHWPSAMEAVIEAYENAAQAEEAKSDG